MLRSDDQVSRQDNNVQQEWLLSQLTSIAALSIAQLSPQ